MADDLESDLEGADAASQPKRSRKAPASRKPTSTDYRDVKVDDLIAKLPSLGFLYVN